MRILFDHNMPRTFRTNLKPHFVRTTREMNWQTLENGDLLRQAETSFDVVVTTDKSIKYQQNVLKYKVALIVLRAMSNDVEDLIELVPQRLETLDTIQNGECVYLYTAAAREREAKLPGKSGK